jgi:hypothetical protein
MLPFPPLLLRGASLVAQKLHNECDMALPTVPRPASSAGDSATKPAR